MNEIINYFMSKLRVREGSLGLDLGLGLGLGISPGGEVGLNENPPSSPFQALNNLQITSIIPEIPISFSSDILAFPTKAWLCWSQEMNPLNLQQML